MTKKHYKIITSCKIICAFLALFAGIGITLSSSPASAATSESELMERVLLNALNTCYDSQYMTNGPVLASEYVNFGVSALLTSAGKNDKVIYIPSQIGNSISGAKITCKEVFDGKDNKLTGLFAMYGKKTDYLAGLGYHKCEENDSSPLCTTTGNSEKCFALNYTVSNGNSAPTQHKTNSVCFVVKQDGKLDLDNPLSTRVNSDGDNGPVQLGYEYDGYNYKLTIRIAGAAEYSDYAVIGEPLRNMTWTQFTDKASDTAQNHIDNAQKYDSYGGLINMGLEYTSPDITGGNDNNTENYIKRSKDIAVNRAISYFTSTKYTGLSQVGMGDMVYDLLQAYFLRLVNENKIFVEGCYKNRNEARVNSSEDYGYAHFDQTTQEWCSVRISSTADRNEKFNVVNSNYNGLTPVTLEKLLELITNWNFASDTSDPDPDPNPDAGIIDDTNNNGGGSSVSETNKCFEQAGALGWILCPVINIVSNATDSIYNDYIQSNFLEVNSSTAAIGSDLYKSWQTIRNVANILFIIAFIVVIISQITGLFVSNYGIKKLLPRLIIVVVLVNLSFLICQFAIDVSNVLGYALNQLFVSITPELTGGLGGAGLTGSVVMSGLSWTGIALIAFNTAGYWLIPLGLAALSGIISVLLAGIVLGLRQAGIIILVALAPVAITCYALPNTKKIFDRWLKIFLSLLLVFPICGALMGGGNFASNLVLQASDSVLVAIIAMLIKVGPFFMIPGLVRTSLTTAGAIGNKVATWGSHTARSARGALSRSDFIRQREGDLARFQGSTTALRGRLLNRVLGKTPDDLSDRRKARIARQLAKYNKLRGEEATAFPYAMTPGSREYTAMQNAAHQKRISTLADNIATENIGIATDTGELESRLYDSMVAYNASGSDEDLAAMQAFDSMLVRGGDDGISGIQNSLGRATNAGLSRSVQALGQHLVNSHTKDIKPVARELYGAAVAAAAGDLRAGSFTENNGLFTSMEYLKNSISGYDPSTIGKMNETSLQRMIDNADTLKDDANFVEKFNLLSTKALTNPNLHVQPKVIDKINTLRTKLNLGKITITANDSGAIQVHGADGGSGAVLNTGNDSSSSRKRRRGNKRR